MDTVLCSYRIWVANLHKHTMDIEMYSAFGIVYRTATKKAKMIIRMLQMNVERVRASGGKRHNRYFSEILLQFDLENPYMHKYFIRFVTLSIYLSVKCV